jgi:cytochrome c
MQGVLMVLAGCHSRRSEAETGNPADVPIGAAVLDSRSSLRSVGNDNVRYGFMAIVVLLIALLPLPAHADMRGHGGPVKAIAISPDGKTAVTGSFDTTVIVWDLETETAKQVLRFHEGPVNHVRISANATFETASDDGRVARWTQGQDQPQSVTQDRSAPVVGLTAKGALHADGLFRSPGGDSIRLAGRPLAVTPAGEDAVVSTEDARLRWIGSGRSMALPATANTLASSPDGEMIAGGADGKLTILKADGSIRLTIEVQEMPITSLAVSTDGRLIAAAGLRGAVKIIRRDTGSDVSTLVGPGLPVWSLAFHPDGRTILTGGADRVVRKWDVASGQPLTPANAPRPDFPASAMNERGAQVFRACEACHTVTPDGGNRAGPTLHGVFGRRIGTAKDYIYSQDFGKHPITWNAETITRLFRDGPLKVTPGTKMPEQIITDTEDLKALVEWLGRVTR